MADPPDINSVRDKEPEKTGSLGDSRSAQVDDEEHFRVAGTRTQEEMVLVRAFRDGVRRVCNRHFWQAFENEMETSRQKDLAQECALHRAEVDRCKLGIVSTDVLFAMITEIGAPLARYDPLPSVSERAIEGYQYAVDVFLNGDRLKRPSARPLVTAETLLFVLYAAKSESLRREQDSSKKAGEKSVPPDDWVSIYNEVAQSVANALGITLSDLSCKDGYVLRRHWAEWAKAVVTVRQKIPYRWIDESIP